MNKKIAQSENDNNSKLLIVTSTSIIVYVFLMLAASISLIFVFDFPDILREPVEVMLTKFNNNRDLVIPAYYLFVLSGLAFIFMVLLIHKAVVQKESVPGFLAVVFGVLFGLTSNLGFIRWPFLMDYLSQMYNNPTTTFAQKEIIKITFNSFHNYAGVAVGENFAFWFEGFWTIFISQTISNRSDLFPKYLSKIGYIIGAGMLVYTLEQFGGVFALLGVISMIIHAGLLVWLLAISVIILQARNGVYENPRLSKTSIVILLLLYLSLLLTAYL
ncbi:MAG: DUF4386 domain-containing protein [Ignavibacteriae bacterium]|nr:DUF4386 domain-containing protein [Ignavibacteriota bacterium]